MGLPEPCVLYAHTFVHPHLDEYVDEVLFPEPVVITACEFLEQNASSSCPAVKLVGATSPPSFALEVFVQCEGETRFRRLCLPCLYSHSSSNVLEIEAIVTSHLVIRGSYRSLSMVVYGNTAEDLGQFNVEVDLDGSLADTVSAVEGNLEDLPPAFRPSNLTVEDLVSSLRLLSQEVVSPDILIETRQLLQLVFKVMDSQGFVVEADKVISSLLKVVSTYATSYLPYKVIDLKQLLIDGTSVRSGDAVHFLTEAGKEISYIYKRLKDGDPPGELAEENLFLECDHQDVPTSKELVDTLYQNFNFCSSAGEGVFKHLSKIKSSILWLSMTYLLCSARESCFHFVNCGGMKQLGYTFTHRPHNSTAFILLLLGVIEQATRHSIGCEGFLGWWPREDESIPSGTSDGYNQLLKLLLENPRHVAASLATYILQRMRFYEVACRYECSVLSVLGSISAVGWETNFIVHNLSSAKMELKNLLKLIKLSGPINDPSPAAAASRSLNLGDGGLLTYKSTRDLINQSNCSFSNWDIDLHLLSLLKERGFLPLSAALLSSSVLRSETGQIKDLLVDVVLNIEAIILSLLFSRSGLNFILHDPEIFSTVIHALRGLEDLQKEDSLSLRYASILISKGFFCQPKEVGMIVEMHARALIAIDKLQKLAPNSEEFLWVLWDLCRLSRSESGRQALLVLANFPEALSVLVTALHSGRELDPVSLTTGDLPLNLAIFHSAAEIFEVIVTDSTVTSLKSWIEHAKELHKALHSSSPSSNRKDAPGRLLEWIDAGVVYHRNGAIGLLRYAAVLASGGDAHMASNSVLASDITDVDNINGDSSNGSDGSIIDSLIGKRITEKDFPGGVLRDSSIAQLTTAFRILAFLSDDSVAAAALYDEGAVMVVHAVMINCKFMLERSSNIYDYLVDEGTEGNSTSDLLLERNREKSICDLLIPSLVLLINLLQKLQEVKEQHRNTKLMNTLLQLHREVSLKVAAFAAELSHNPSDFAFGFGAVCHLIASALACWPAYSWTPGLFHILLDSLHTTSLLALGPKETCSLLCLLNDLFPSESIWMWKNGLPMLSPLRAFGVGTILGPLKEKQINWYLSPGHPEKLLTQLSPQLVKLGEVILHCATSVSTVIQDILRVFIIRITCLDINNALILVKPMISWISHRLSEPLALSNVDLFKVNQLLNFLASSLEHPNAKLLLLNEDGFQMLRQVLERCSEAADSDVKQFPENANISKYEVSLLSLSVPVFNSISLICDGRPPVLHSVLRNRDIADNFRTDECSILCSYLLRFLMVLPVGREMLVCLSAFKEMCFSAGGRSGLLSVFKCIQSSTISDSVSQIKYENDVMFDIITPSEWKEHPPLLCCWTTLLRSIKSKAAPGVQVAAAMDMLASGALGFCMDGESLNMERVTVIRFFFGVNTTDYMEGFAESLEHVSELTNLLELERSNGEVKESVSLLLQLLQKSSGLEEVDANIASTCSSLLKPPSSRIQRTANRSMKWTDDSNLDELGAKFSWECPENSHDRLLQTGLPAKRKISALEISNRRPRGDNPVPEATSQSTFSRGLVPVTTTSGPGRRDTFRQRKPNTSRPPSMHVDDYVARERNSDGNVIAVPRIGSTSGRPPSIHVDEFMARQKERQNVVGVAVTDAGMQVKTTAQESNIDAEKSSKLRQLKPDLDDDLQGIDIVFDAEESEPDDKLPFPQPDDILQQPASVLVEQLSPRSIVEETESDVNESSQFSHLGTSFASIMDENTQSEFSSRLSASQSEKPLNREPSISSDKKFSDRSEYLKNLPPRTSTAMNSPIATTGAGGAASVYIDTQSSVKLPVDSRTPPNSFSKTNVHQSGTVLPRAGSQVFYDQTSSQPPLPPMPPPPTVSPIMPQNVNSATSNSSFFKSATDVPAQFPPGFHVQSEYVSGGTKSSITLSETKLGRTSLSSPGGSTRPPPPLPPTPPPYSGGSSPLPSLKNSTSQSPQYFQPISNFDQQTSIGLSGDVVNLSTSRSVLTTYAPTPLMQPLLFRPGSMPVNLYGNSFVPHHSDNFPSVSQNVPISLPSPQTMPTVAQLQPLQPPQIPRPPVHLRPPVPAPPQSDHGVPLLHVPVQMSPQSQVLQQSQVSSAQVYYQTQQQDDRSQVSHLPGDGTSQQQDSGMSLQEYFRSPEAIQSLLSDRDKLCELLEQHPKLMQMLQERLGHL